MNAPLPPSSYVLVFDTEQYSGNFERQLVAYVTGCSGECGVGAEEASMALADLPSEVVEWLDNHVLHLPDDHGCCRPASIWPTPGWFNDGRGNHHRDGEDEAVVLEQRRASIEASAEQARSLYLHLGEVADQKFSEELAKADAPLRRYPAYQSVSIVLDERPDGVLEALLRGRAQVFCSREGITLTGHRLLRVGPQLFVAASSTPPVLPQEQQLHYETNLVPGGKAFETFGPIELADSQGSGLFVRGTSNSRTVVGIDPPGLLNAVLRMASVNEAFRLGLFELVTKIFKDGRS